MARIHVRLARESDLPGLRIIQRESVTRSCDSGFTLGEREAYLQLALEVDRQLIADGTCFVACFGARVIGFGGWSDRRRLEALASGAEARALAPATAPSPAPREGGAPPQGAFPSGRNALGRPVDSGWPGARAWRERCRLLRTFGRPAACPLGSRCSCAAPPW